MRCPRTYVSYYFLKKTCSITCLTNLAASNAVWPLSYIGQTSVTSNPTSCGEKHSMHSRTSKDVKPKGSGVLVPGAYAKSITSISSVRYIFLFLRKAFVSSNAFFIPSFLILKASM